MDKMAQWRDGLLSDAEIIGWLLNDNANIHNALDEVRQVILAKETKIADERLAKLGVEPLSA